MNSLLAITGSKARAEIFRLLFERPGLELYLRDLQRRSGLSISPIQQELGRLTRAGFIKMRRDGNRVYYSANFDHPLFPEIRGIVEKTVGVIALLRRMLTVPEIQVVFIFGSLAAGTARPDSDLDLFVIGSIGLRNLSGLLIGVNDKIGRIVNPHVSSHEEFLKKFAERNPFITTIMESPKTFVIGNENDLK